MGRVLSEQPAQTHPIGKGLWGLGRDHRERPNTF